MRWEKLFVAAVVAVFVFVQPADAQRRRQAGPPPAPEPPALVLATPPDSAPAWVIVSAAGEHGREWRWTDADGVHWSRSTSSLRGFSSDTDQALTLDPQGRPLRLVVRGETPQGVADEVFERVNGRAVWASTVDRGEAPDGGTFYLPFNGSLDAFTALARALIASPTRSLDLLPSGRARIDQLTQRAVRSTGGERLITAWVITGLAWYPSVVWLDQDNNFFASVDYLAYVPVGWQGVETELTRAQNEALAQRATALAARIGRRPRGPVMFEDVRLYDADAGVFRDHMSVLVEDGRIVEVASAALLRAPRESEVILGAGRTLIPGLWDSHMHFSDDTTGPLLLANGITSIRDPGNDPTELEARIQRIAAGQLLGPRIFPSLLIDGPGPRAAQSARLASNVNEALEHVRYAASHGYVGVKLYGSISPSLVAPLAAEAHRLGLRVGGHLPAGMRPHEAIEAGYDELTHFYFTLMEAMPDAVVAESNGMMRLFGPAQYGADLDYRMPPMGPLLDDMAERGIVADPTINLIERLLLPAPGELPATYAAYEGAMPGQIERGLRAGALQAPEGLTRERIQASANHMVDAIAEMRRRGVTVIAGTDGFGLELVRELELYVQSGLTPAEALATATIAPARVINRDTELGSIAVGKYADLVLIDGDPERDIGALRNVDWVMANGRLMEARRLREALGMGAPRR